MGFLAMYQKMKEAVDRARNGEEPTIVEAKVYRITPHSSDDDDRSCRTREEVEQFKQRDPLFIARKALEKESILTLPFWQRWLRNWRSSKILCLGVHAKLVL